MSFYLMIVSWPIWQLVSCEQSGALSHHTVAMDSAAFNIWDDYGLEVL